MRIVRLLSANERKRRGTRPLTVTILTDSPALEPGVVDVWIFPPEGSPCADLTEPQVSSILARYTGDDPARIRLVRGRNGKPELDPGAQDIRFNLSRTQGTMLLAVSLGIEVGVDVERIRDGPWHGLPAHVLTRGEQTDLESCDLQSRAQMFLTYWVRKEAVLKAAGVGLAIEPLLVEVTAPWKRAGITAIPPELAPASRWTLVDLPVPGCAAALAAEAPGIVPRFLA
jgi:4'-phosphopantetheinyl transferase